MPTLMTKSTKGNLLKIIVYTAQALLKAKYGIDHSPSWQVWERRHNVLSG
jgi:hypothetical protein